MNCGQTAQLLPLFVGDDLTTRETTDVTRHLAICPQCREAEIEYRDTMAMFETYDTPVISEAVYANIRRNVLSEIDTIATAPIRSIFAAIFQPRYRWAMAALILMTAMFTLSRLDTRKTVEMASQGLTKIELPQIPETASQPLAEVIEQSSVGKSSRPLRKLAGFKSRRVRPEKTQVATMARRDRTDRNPTPAPDSVASLTTNDTATQPLRIEMQTKDPNIRIIWFTKHPN